MGESVPKKEITMRWILALIAGLVLLSLAWKLLLFTTGIAYGMLHLVVVLAIVIFLIGLVRRLMLIR